MERKELFPKLRTSVEDILSLDVSDQRKASLKVLIDFVDRKIVDKEQVNINFICTHNSRRSQLSQVWATVAASQYDIPVTCFSGGVEVTSFNHRAVESLRRSGFQIESDGTDNPTYNIRFAEDVNPVTAFSKLFDDQSNSSPDFAAVMTCSDADENCPFIPGASARIPIRYEDPKRYDDTDQEAEQYDIRSRQIASEMFYVFSQVSNV